MRLAFTGFAVHAYTDNVLIATTAYVFFSSATGAFGRGRGSGGSPAVGTGRRAQGAEYWGTVPRLRRHRPGSTGVHQEAPTGGWCVGRSTDCYHIRPAK